LDHHASRKIDFLKRKQMFEEVVARYQAIQEQEKKRVELWKTGKRIKDPKCYVELSHYTGVYWDNDNRQWISQTNEKGEHIILYKGIDEEEASRVYDAYIDKLYAEWRKK
jgi:hypothetical protein